MTPIESALAQHAANDALTMNRYLLTILGFCAALLIKELIVPFVRRRMAQADAAERQEYLHALREVTRAQEAIVARLTDMDERVRETETKLDHLGFVHRLHHPGESIE